MWTFKDLLGKTKTHYGYSVPITIQEILDQEYAIPVWLDYYDFEDDVLKQIQSSSFWASQIYEMTGKRNGNSFIIARNEAYGWIKPEEDTSSEKEPEIWGLPA